MSPETAKVWSVAQHDVPPPVDFFLNPLETHAYLLAFLRSEGHEFTKPYGEVRNHVKSVVEEATQRKRRGQPPSEDVTDQRLRTWKKTFESFGIVSVDAQSRLTLTPLGRAVKALYDRLNDEIEGANDKLAELAVRVLGRYLLRNPVDEGEYPEDCDLFPFRFLWRAMRKLDNKIHWEELNRVLMKVLRRDDEATAIQEIREARRKSGGTYTAANLESLLGKPTISEGAETKRRITPWLQRAGFGGLLLTPEDDDKGFRHLVQEHVPLIDAELESEPEVPQDARETPAKYLRYLTEVPVITGPGPDAGDNADISRVVEAVEKFGTNKIIALAGIPGTGKSHLARLVATRLVSGDTYRYKEIQFHENLSYEDFMEGFVPKPGGEGFELVDKVFKTINRRANLDPARARYVLVIEELTRGNVHGVLGELLTYVEHRGRPFQLSLSQKEMRVAPNLVVLATMNPRDKTALILDQAILRRIHQIPLPPSATRLAQILDGKLAVGLLNPLVEWFRKFEGVTPFGHAEFSRVRTEQDLRDLWNGTLRHFLVDSESQIRPQYQDLAQEFPWR